MRCPTARRWITTGLAGEAPPWRRRALARHLEGCEGCRRERTAYAALDRALALLPLEAAVPVALERDVARRVRAAAVDAAPAPHRVPWWVGVPALAGAAVLALAVRGATLRTDVPSPDASATRHLLAAAPPAARPATPSAAHPRPAEGAAKRRRPPAVVPSDPPPELTARPDLFVDLPILRNLERLEHFESIQTTTVEDQDGGRSNG